MVGASNVGKVGASGNDGNGLLLVSGVLSVVGACELSVVVVVVSVVLRVVDERSEDEESSPLSKMYPAMNSANNKMPMPRTQAAMRPLLPERRCSAGW